MSSDVLPSVPEHLTEDLLEEYSFGRVSEPALAPLEEHLLVCDVCQTKLVAVEEYRALMKSGLAALERERQASFVRPRRFVFPGITGFRTLLAAALMLMLVSAVVAWRTQTSPALDSQPATVRLIALRGGDGDGVARALAGHSLNLVVDRTDLPPAPSYRLEMVSSSGRPEWSGTAQIAAQDISAHVTGRFQPGIYWVRLYADDRLLREFGLHIE